MLDIIVQNYIVNFYLKYWQYYSEYDMTDIVVTFGNAMQIID